MGAFLDKPKTEKLNDTGTGAGLRFGVASMQGWRIDMEDAHVAKIGLSKPGFEEWAFFAIFDGHAGSRVAHHSSLHLFDSIMNTEEMGKSIKLVGSGTPSDDSAVIEYISSGLRTGFLSLDEHMRRLPELHGENERSGSTAVAVLISPTHVFFANLGDSRSVYSRSGLVKFATEDHKPFHPRERERIVNAGGSVMIQRVNGSLAVSRALGDYEYKSVDGVGPTEQLVSPEPDISVLERSPEDEFILLACDGVYDVMTSPEVCDFVRSRMNVVDSLSEIGNLVLDACLSKGSRDNMSTILVSFESGPRMNQAALQRESALKKDLESRIRNVASLCDGVDDLDCDYVFKIIIHQDIPNLPPGAGLHGIRGMIDQIIDRLKRDPSVFDSSQASSAGTTANNSSNVSSCFNPGSPAAGSPPGPASSPPTTGSPSMWRPGGTAVTTTSPSAAAVQPTRSTKSSPPAPSPGTGGAPSSKQDKQQRAATANSSL